MCMGHAISLMELKVKVRGQGYCLSSKRGQWDLDPQSRTEFLVTVSSRTLAESFPLSSVNTDSMRMSDEKQADTIRPAYIQPTASMLQQSKHSHTIQR